jgi:hypothetical protein
MSVTLASDACSLIFGATKGFRVIFMQGPPVLVVNWRARLTHQHSNFHAPLPNGVARAKSLYNNNLHEPRGNPEGWGGLHLRDI